MCVLVQLVVKDLKYSPKLVKEERRGLDAKARHKNTTAHFADELCRFLEAMRQVFFLQVTSLSTPCVVSAYVSAKTLIHVKRKGWLYFQ